MNSCFRVQELRKKVGLTQAQLAFRLDLKAPSTVAMWESGARNPPSTMLPQLAHELHCTVDELYQSQDITEAVR